jgi:hypothetical protein
MPVNTRKAKLISQEKDLNYPLLIAKNFLYIMVGLGFVAFVAGVYFFVYPVYLDIKEVKAEISTKEKELQTQRLVLGKMRKVSSDYNQIPLEDKAKIFAMAPDRKTNEDVYAAIEKLVSDSGFLLKNVKIQDTQTAKPAETASTLKVFKPTVDGLVKFNVDIVVSVPDYASLKRLLTAIERSNRIMDIVDINYSPSAGEVALRMFIYRIE